MNNWIGLCFLKSHGIFPLSEAPWGLCCWKHCQLKLSHFHELPQEWERFCRCCHMPCSESISCGELISSVPLSLGHLKGHELSPCSSSSTRTRGNHGCSLLSEECEKAAAAALVLRQVWFAVWALAPELQCRQEHHTAARALPNPDPTLLCK